MKAFGAKKSTILLIYCIEGFIIWLIGYMIGMIGGYQSGFYVSDSMKKIFQMTHAIPLYEFNFYQSTYIALGILLVSILIIIFSAWAYSKNNANKLLRSNG